jgi:immune inhibitor A
LAKANSRGSRNVRRSAALFFLGLFAFLAATACQDSGGHPATPSPAQETAVATSTPSSGVELQPAPDLDNLPSRDLLDLARRLRGVENPPADPINPLPQSLSVGDRHLFNVIMMPSPGQGGDIPPRPLEIRATLRLVTPHSYFYVQDGESVSGEAIAAAGQAFEDTAYPAVTEAMGRERSPGIDNDTHITIFNGNLEGAAGYFSDLDGYPQALAPLSNEREMVYMDLSLDIGSDGYTSVLAHELQHLIHANGNPREDLWINEGLSEVAGALPGGQPSFGDAFLETPDTQLTEWDPSGDNYAHYGAAGLFFHYLSLRTGVAALHDLVFENDKGITGINDFLRLHGGSDFESLFADWLVANRSRGPAGYLADSESVAVGQTLDSSTAADATVRQFAADYIEVDTPGSFTFDGTETVPLLADKPHSGSGRWWSARGDSIDTKLTRELDLTSVDSATLNFWTWFDIEKWYDYGYVEISADSGNTWQVLSGRRTTQEDPVRQAYGPGYTGRSGGGDTPEWVEESIDLSAFAGQKVLLRFEYVTDGGLNTPGWAIDDVSVPEIGLSDGAENGGDWAAEGFQRVTGNIAQRFIVQVIEGDGQGQVRQVQLDTANDATVELRGPDQGVTKSVVVIAAVSPATSEQAEYAYSFVERP